MNFENVNIDNREHTAQVLSSAFKNDPVMNWSCNHPASLAPFFRFALPLFASPDLSYLDGERRGAACWLGPDETLDWPVRPSSVALIWRLGGPRAVYRMLLSGHQTEKHHPAAPHYYLFAIGVQPRYKGQGVGSTLISRVLRRCDDESVPAYLENSRRENLPFYEGHGFRVMEQIRFARSAPPLWLMWRDPVTPGA